nr:hypothetical protein [Tanacetum cinerariifolium]GEX87824.1 hypothetical protein [Tanacetum cinerariifolium]
FWSTAMAKTINGEAQLHVRVDGKKIIITEASIRRDLQLADEEGFDCLPNSTIFEQLALMGVGKSFSGRITPLFPIMVVQSELGEDEVVYKELGDSLVRASTTASSLEAKHDSGGGPRCQEAMRDTTAQTRFKSVSKNSNNLLLARELTLAQAFKALKTSKPKVKGIVVQEQKEPGKSTTTTTTISKQQSQDKGKGIMIEEPVKPKKKD